MRYAKVLVIVLVFFLSMVFFFQNQTALSSEMVLTLNLFFVPPMSSMSLPLYFLVLVAFLLGALVALIILIWDKMNLSARHMKATWRIRTLEKEMATLKRKSETESAKADTADTSLPAVQDTANDDAKK